MAGGGGDDDGRVLTTGATPPTHLSNFLHNHATSDQPLHSLFFSSTPPPPTFFGSAGSTRSSMVSFEGRKQGYNSNKFPLFSSAYDLVDYVENGEDDYFHQTEKKRRLSADQVQFLEKSFQVVNKLEPERKTKLAKDLGLQPRQVAIWFQNRRARWKSKQMESDYDSLNHTYQSLKTDYDNLLKEKDRLQAEVASLTEKVLERDKLQKALVESVWEGDQGSKISSAGGCTSNKQVELADITSSARSEVLDLDSSDGFEAELSSQQDEEGSYLLLHDPYMLQDHPLVNSSNFGFPEEDHSLWPWSY